MNWIGYDLWEHKIQIDIEISKREELGGLQGGGGVVDGVRAKRQNRAVEEVKHRHFFSSFFLSFSVSD